MLRHKWPGNIRELHATLIRASLWNAGTTISEAEIEDAVFPQPSGTESILGRDLTAEFDIQDVIREVARHYIERALKKNGGRKTKAADDLGFNSYQTLSNWMKRLRIEI